MNKLSKQFRLSRRGFQIRRLAAVFGVTIFMFGLFATSARPAAALFGINISTTIGDIPRTIFDFVDNVKEKLASAFKISNDIAFKNSLSVFQSHFNEQVLTAVSTAAPGQKPLFLTNPKSFFSNVVDSAAGDYIDDFTRGVTGQRGPGTALSSSRQRFLISRFLRAQLGDPLEQCREDCRTFFSTAGLDAKSVTEFTREELENVEFRNDHERNIAFVTHQLETVIRPATKDENADVICQNVYQPPSTGSYIPWTIGLGYCGDTNNLQGDCQTKTGICVHRLEEGIRTEYAAAQTQTEQCFQDCRAGAGAASKAIQEATRTDVFASDIFSSSVDIDLNQTPAAVANALRRDTSDFGQLLTAAATLTAAVQEQVTGEQTKISADLLPRTSRVSDQVITPKSGVQASLQASLFGSDANKVYTGTGLADILKGVASFINSPVGRLLSNMVKSQCGLNPEVCRGPSQPKSVIGQILFGSGPTGIAGAKLQFAQLGQVDLITGDPGRNEISVTDQLASSGLIDAQFRSAIEDQLTVSEALDRNLLDGKKTFGFDQNGLQATNGYSFRALQYLRKFRVTPVGWELAARYSQRFDQRALSLDFLTGHFNLCAQDPKKKICSDTGDPCASETQCAEAATCVETAEFTTADHQVCSNNYAINCTQDADCSGGRCGASPYCGLVDPNWVLKAPQTYCRRQGAGEEILTKEYVCDQNNVNQESGLPIPPGELVDPLVDGDNGAPNCIKSATNKHPDVGRWIIARNTETCGDVQSCVAENEDGTCLAYGYCVQERQTFKFDGQQCSPENATCTTYVDDAGQRVSYLANTLDTRNCNADVAGCQMYCSVYDEANNRWACGANPSDAETINFTAQAQSCSASQQGCRQFIRTGSGTNLLPNSGFETFSGAAIDSGATGLYSVNGIGWNPGGASLRPVTADDALMTTNNTAAVSVQGSAGDRISQTIDTGHQLYERTFYATLRAKADNDCSATLRLDTDAGSVSQPVSVSTVWSTLGAALSLPSNTQVISNNNTITYTLELGTCDNAGLVIDSAQLEEGDGISAYKDYGAVNNVFLSGARRQCAADDVGCQAYSRVSDKQIVNGIVRENNRCSADAVGCATYILEKIETTPTRPGGTVNIVAPKGRVCSAAQVGCEEYTNLDEVSRGGEGREYYSRVRQCVRPEHPGKSTYYTWIGDARRGFVLRAYDLLKSDAGSAPCTNVKFGNSTGSAPECEDTADSIAAAQLGCTSSADLAKNPDCAEYYDAGLNIFYRLRSKTISVTNDCKPYRNTVDQTDDDASNNDRVYFLSRSENTSCSAAAAGCRAYTGNAGRTTRQLLSDNFESGTVSNWFGAQPSAESVNLGGHSILIPAAANPVKGAAYTKPELLQSQLFAGRTYIVTLIAAATESCDEDATTPAPPCPTIGASFGTGSGNTFSEESGQQFTTTGGLRWNNRTTPAGPEWQAYTFGPLQLPNAPAPSFGITVTGGDAFVDNVVLTEVTDSIYLISQTVPMCTAAEVGCLEYRDRSGQRQYLTSFARLCSQEVVGCEAMIDTHNSTTPFEQEVKNEKTPADNLTTLVHDRTTYCAASAKGCQALGRPAFAQDGTLTGYSTVYRKNNPDRHILDLCLNNERSCRAYQTANGNAAFFKDPGTNVCEYRVTNPEQGGQWFVVGTDYRCPTVNVNLPGRPVGKSCSPVCADGDRAGKACVTADDCPNSSGGCVGDIAQAGRINGGAVGSCDDDTQCTNANNKCVYQAGDCPDKENGCTEYRDPTDPVSCRSECTLTMQGGSPLYVDQNCVRTTCLGNSQTEGQNCQTSEQCGSGGRCVGLDQNASTTGLAGCRSYTYIRQSIETQASECNGQIDTAAGCRPFNDTSKPSLNYRGL